MSGIVFRYQSGTPPDATEGEAMTATETTIRTLGEMRAAMKQAKAVYVWCNWEGEDGEYFKVTKDSARKAMSIDAPNDGAYGGKGDWVPCRGRLDSEGNLYIN